jgi:hypothetical protein
VSLNITKVAYGCTSLTMLVAAVARRAEDGQVRMTTRYIPKRHADIVAGGSLYWIVKHQIVARAMRCRPNWQGNWESSRYFDGPRPHAT